MSILDKLFGAEPETELRREFIVEVERRSLDEEFTFADLAFRHQNCGGGIISIHSGFYQRLQCKRCLAECDTVTGDDGLAKLCLTARDGERRELWFYRKRSPYTHLVVVPSNLPDAESTEVA